MKRTNSNRQRMQQGFSVVEVLIVVAVVAVLLAFGFVRVTRARASMRLSGAAREYGSYIERVRVHALLALSRKFGTLKVGDLSSSATATPTPSGVPVSGADPLPETDPQLVHFC